LIIIGLTLTFTRGAYVAGIVSLLVYGAHHRRHTINIVAAGVICLVVAMMSIDRVWDGLAGRDTMNQLENFRTDQRGLAYAHAAAMFRDSPLLGVGVGHYRISARRHGDFNDTPDNMYLRMIAERGIVGLTMTSLLFAVLISRLRTAVRSEQAGPSTRAVTYAVLASLIVFWISCLTCDVLLFPLTRIQFWMIVGAGLALWRTSTETGSSCPT
jgi:O-antigen ligase